MRCEPNVSISKTDKLGTKVEVKNIGSISSVGEAIKYEVARQKEILEKGEELKEQTRRFDDKTRTTILMRYKETGNDYRYFPEPDIPWVHLTDEFINNSYLECLMKEENHIKMQEYYQLILKRLSLIKLFLTI